MDQYENIMPAKAAEMEWRAGQEDRQGRMAKEELVSRRRK